MNMTEITEQNCPYCIECGVFHNEHNCPLCNTESHTLAYYFKHEVLNKEKYYNDRKSIFKRRRV